MQTERNKIWKSMKLKSEYIAQYKRESVYDANFILDTVNESELANSC